MAAKARLLTFILLMWLHIGHSAGSLRKRDTPYNDLTESKPMTRSEKHQLRKTIDREVTAILREVNRGWKAVDPSEILPREPTDNEREILLMGDSLLGLPSKQFALEKMLKEELERREPGHHVLVNLYVKPGARTVSMRERILKSIAPRGPDWKRPPPEALIIYWDSDLVDVDNPVDQEVIKPSYTPSYTQLLFKGDLLYFTSKYVPYDMCLM